MKLVTIGVPVYNGGRHLRQALESTLSQTYPKLEVVICDNASTDATQEICHEYAAADDRVSVYRNEKNFGAAFNYNKVARLARGEYFKWAAHDDVLAPTHIESCVGVLDREPAAVLCYPRPVIIDDEGTQVADYDDRLHTDSSLPDLRLRRFLHKAPESNPVFGLIRASALSSTNLIGSYDSSDYVLLAELALQGEIHELPQRLFFRRVRTGTDRPRLTNRERALWFDTSARGPNALPFLRVLFELCRSVLVASLTMKQKALCLGEIVRAAPALGARTLAWLRLRRHAGSPFVAHTGNFHAPTRGRLRASSVKAE